MSNMVYLITSLPSLSLKEEPPITMDEFYGDAKKQLSSRDFKILESVDIRNFDHTIGIKSISSLLESTRNDLSAFREARAQNRAARPQQMPESVFQGNPLEREVHIMQWQWQQLQDIESANTFNLTEVLVYKLKLQLVSRMHSFSREKGAEVLASVIDPDEKRRAGNGRNKN